MTSSSKTLEMDKGEAAPSINWQAPREDRSVLMVPAPHEMADVLAANRALQAAWQFDLQGRSIAQLSQQSRRHLLEEALRYTRRYRDVSVPVEVAEADLPPLVLAGHQPQLFHAGVWLKNFALADLARNHGAVAINLIVDNDVMQSSSVRVPAGNSAQPRWEALPLDTSAEAVPYEQRAIRNRDVFASFGERAAKAISHLMPDPMLREFWPVVEKIAEENIAEESNLGRTLSQARHMVEGHWGFQSLEVPLGLLCDGEPFRWLAAYLLAQLPAVRHAYNESLAEYRHENKLRSHSHPAPDLAKEEGWLEAPLWVWSNAAPRRQRLFARQTSQGIELTDRAGWLTLLSLSTDQPADDAVRQLAALAEQGIKLRPRALITTLFTRLLLGDLFVHGIGGAKYDRVTDRLFCRLFGTAAPRYGVVSGTLMLPVVRPLVAQEDLRRIDEQSRELRFHPERHIRAELLRADPAVRAAVASKQAAIGSGKQDWLKPARKERHQTIAAANAALQTAVAGQQAMLAEERVRMAELLRSRAILASREWAYCLLPADHLRRWILDLFGASA